MNQAPAQTEKTPATTPTQTTKKPPLNKPQAISKAGVNPLPRSPGNNIYLFFLKSKNWKLIIFIVRDQTCNDPQENRQW